MPCSAAKSRSAKGQVDAALADRLIDEAERLYGEHGLDNVSLRQICIAAGSGNNYAVQYHFGDAAGLIQAILAKRMPDVERKRAELFAELKAQKRLDTRGLMEVLYRPLIEHQDARGERRYARFVLALQNSPTALLHAADSIHLMPVSHEAMELMCAAHPEIPCALLHERQRVVAFMVLTSIFRRRTPWRKDPFDTAWIDNAIDMATAAIIAPVSDSVAAMARQHNTNLKGG